MKAMKLAFAMCLLAGVSLALQWEGSSASNVAYDGGSAIPVCSAGNPTYISYSAAIAHMLTVNATLTQNGQEPAEFVSGTADLSVRITANASIGNIVSFSQKDAAIGNPQPSPVPATVSFNSAEYSYISGVYDSCRTSNRANHAHYLNSIYDGGTGPCYHTMNSADAVTVDIGYRSGADNNNCMTGAVQAMGKGYVYCSSGTINVNGKDVGTLSSNGQTLNTQVTLTDGMTALPVSLTYQCYFIAELYNSSGEKQEIQHQIFQMPSGLPITQTIPIPITRVNPPYINLVPIIVLNNTYFYTGNTITVDAPNTKYDISFWVNRTDNVTQIDVPYLNWSLGSTPTELGTITGTHMNFKLNPPLWGAFIGIPVQLPGTAPPITITVCRPGIETDTVVLDINQWHSILETDYGNSITLIFDCSGLDKPICRFNPPGLITYPGQTKMTNMSCYDRNTMEPIDCPMWNGFVITHANGDFQNHYQPLAWTYDSSENATNQAYATAKGSTNPNEGPYSDTVTATFPGSYSPPFRCSFNLDWRRPDCRYYM